jgi:hypothetical protein
MALATIVQLRLEMEAVKEAHLQYQGLSNLSGR